MIEHIRRHAGPMALCALLGLLGAPALAQPAPHGTFSLEQVLAYPFVNGLVSAEHADRIAWIQNIDGVRNLWVASGPEFKPRQVTRYTADDGQELTQPTFSPDGAHLIYVRGGDHDANWPAEGGLEPDPNSNTEQPQVTIWAASLGGGAPVKVAEGDAPALSSKGRLAYVKDGQVWTAPLEGPAKASKEKPERLFFDRGKDRDLVWSPDGSRLAFVSDRGDHRFIGVFTTKEAPLVYLAPSTGRDGSPVWSPDGRRIAFTREPGEGGVPEPLLTNMPHPWSILVAEAGGGGPSVVWRSPDTLDGSYPDVAGGANLMWGAGDRLTFLAELDNWPHLYAVPATGGAPSLLTPGAFMVEDIAQSRDKRALIYSANTGGTPGDDDRRHLFRTPIDHSAPTPLTSGDGLQWGPAAVGGGEVAFVSAGPRRPPVVTITGPDGQSAHDLDTAAIKAFPSADLVTPKLVSFRSPDGVTVQGQLFQREDGAAKKPGVIFVHGGPPRQMLLGWHYMDYYSNSYAVNQYLAAHGFVVLSVNYRLGVGYGRAFQQPDHAGPAGAAEYQDVLAGARFLQHMQGVDPERIGIWGGSYGGYLTAMALARNSDVFKAGVDMHGVHDWSRFLGKALGAPAQRYEQGDREQAMKTAFASSPDADIAAWRSPVLMIQGDDDRNVPFNQTIDLARRLDARHVPYEELVIPNEIHGFLRHESWLKADAATVAFLRKELIGGGS